MKRYRKHHRRQQDNEDRKEAHRPPPPRWMVVVFVLFFTTHISPSKNVPLLMMVCNSLLALQSHQSGINKMSVLH